MNGRKGLVLVERIGASPHHRTRISQAINDEFDQPRLADTWRSGNDRETSTVASRIESSGQKLTLGGASDE